MPQWSLSNIWWWREPSHRLKFRSFSLSEFLAKKNQFRSRFPSLYVKLNPRIVNNVVWWRRQRNLSHIMITRAIPAFKVLSLSKFLPLFMKKSGNYPMLELSAKQIHMEFWPSINFHHWLLADWHQFWPQHFFQPMTSQLWNSRMHYYSGRRLKCTSVLSCTCTFYRRNLDVHGLRQIHTTIN